MKKTLIRILIACTMTSLSMTATAQHIVSLTPATGDTIFRFERARYDIFSSATGFAWAVFIENDDGSLLSKLHMKSRDTWVDTVISVPGSVAYWRARFDSIDRENGGPLGDRYENGADLDIRRNDTMTVRGELLSVRADDLVLSKHPLRNDRGALDSAETIFVPKSEIASLRLVGHSRIAAGMGTGLLAGASIGFLLGVASGDDPKSSFIRFSAAEKGLIGAGAAGTVGMVIGLVSGAASSTSEIRYDPRDPATYTDLAGRARFRDGEPFYLRNRR